MKLLDELDQLIDRLRGDAARTADESSMLLQRYIDDHDVGAFRLLRERNPIVTVGPFALVTRYDDVCEVLGAHDAFSQDHRVGSKGEMPYPTGDSGAGKRHRVARPRPGTASSVLCPGGRARQRVRQGRR